MASETSATPTSREPELPGQTVVLLGGSAGIGLETARRARGEGAEVILVGRNPDHLEAAAAEVGAKSTAAFDAADPASLESFFRGLKSPIDHVLVTAGRPRYGPLADMTFEEMRDGLDDHLMQTLYVARAAGDMVRPGGTLVFMGGTAAAVILPSMRAITLGIGVPATAMIRRMTAVITVGRDGVPSFSSSSMKASTWSTTRSSSPGLGFRPR